MGVRTSVLLRALCAAVLLISTSAPAAGNGEASSFGLAVGVLLFIAICAAFYFLPTIIAVVRGHDFKWVIFAINLAAGWTIFGWAAAIVWAVWPKEKSLIDPFVGNPTGLSRRNAGDTMGAADYGRLRGRNAEQLATPGGAWTLTDNQVSQLERLAQLLRSGALTETEFANQKAQIVGGGFR